MVFYDWGGSNDIDNIDHVGIVTKVVGDTIFTIDGNIDGRRQAQERDQSKVAGYGYPEKIRSGCEAARLKEAEVEGSLPARHEQQADRLQLPAPAETTVTRSSLADPLRGAVLADRWRRAPRTRPTQGRHRAEEHLPLTERVHAARPRPPPRTGPSPRRPSTPSPPPPTPRPPPASRHRLQGRFGLDPCARARLSRADRPGAARRGVLGASPHRQLRVRLSRPQSLPHPRPRHRRARLSAPCRRRSSHAGPTGSGVTAPRPVPPRSSTLGALRRAVGLPHAAGPCRAARELPGDLPDGHAC
ncbi:CHAP domain-containing protein [Nonomuraea dietziae]|uniref:CHAP domain-containing protein n=1 Tax=Nonomuraea dietziae TaxID=65515 RepID=UPI0031DB35D2